MPKFKKETIEALKSPRVPCYQELTLEEREIIEHCRGQGRVLHMNGYGEWFVTGPKGELIPSLSYRLADDVQAEEEPKRYKVYEDELHVLLMRVGNIKASIATWECDSRFSHWETADGLGLENLWDVRDEWRKSKEVYGVFV